MSPVSKVEETAAGLTVDSVCRDDEVASCNEDELPVRTIDSIID